EQLIGGRWVPGVSWHPPLAPAQVQVTAAEHPITAGLGEELSVVDERYCDLRVAGDVTVLVDQHEDGRRDPIGWAREAGAGRGGAARAGARRPRLRGPGPARAARPRGGLAAAALSTAGPRARCSGGGRDVPAGVRCSGDRPDVPRDELLLADVQLFADRLGA